MRGDARRVKRARLRADVEHRIPTAHERIRRVEPALVEDSRIEPRPAVARVVGSIDSQIDSSQLPDRSVLDEHGTAGVPGREMTFIGATTGVECGLQYLANRAGAEKTVSVHDSGDHVFSPPLHSVVRRPQPTICFDAKESVGRRNRRTALSAASNDDEASPDLVGECVYLRIVRKCPANAPDF